MGKHRKKDLRQFQLHIFTGNFENLRKYVERNINFFLVISIIDVMMITFLNTAELTKSLVL